MSNFDYDLREAQAHFRAKVAYTTGVHELEVLLNQGKGGFAVVDVRFPPDFNKGHVPGAINLPRGKWTHPRGLDPEQPVYVYCYDQTCHLGAEAAYELAKQGFKAIEVEGGFDRWVQKGFRSEATAQAA